MYANVAKKSSYEHNNMSGNASFLRHRALKVKNTIEYIYSISKPLTCRMQIKNFIFYSKTVHRTKKKWRGHFCWKLMRDHENNFYFVKSQ